MKFMVKVGDNRYLFDSSAEALSFAVVAKERTIEEDGKEVKIILINDGEEIK